VVLVAATVVEVVVEVVVVVVVVVDAVVVVVGAPVVALVAGADVIGVVVGAVVGGGSVGRVSPLGATAAWPSRWLLHAPTTSRPQPTSAPTIRTLTTPRYARGKAAEWSCSLRVRR
jgi:hypothetical protein